MVLTSTSGPHLIWGMLPTGPPLNWFYQIKGFISKARIRWEVSQPLQVTRHLPIPVNCMCRIWIHNIPLIKKRYYNELHLSGISLCHDISKFSPMRSLSAFFLCRGSDPATPICTAVTPVFLPFPITWPPPPTCTPALNYPSSQLHMYQPCAIYSPPWSLTVLLPRPSSNFLFLSDSVFATLLGMGQEIITKLMRAFFFFFSLLSHV